MEDPITLQFATLGNGLLTVGLNEDTEFQILSSTNAGDSLALDGITAGEIRRLIAGLRNALDLVAKLKGRGKKLHDYVRPKKKTST